jgi:O-antigen ligase
VTRFLLLTYAFAAPWCYGFISIGGDRVALTDVLLPITVVVFIARVRIPLTNLQWMLLLYPLAALAASLGALGTGVEGGVFLKTARLWGTFAPALLLTTLGLAEGDLLRYVKAFIAGGAVSLLAGIAGFHLGWEFTAAHQTWDFGAGDLLPRAGGVFQESGAYGHLLASWCVLTLAFLPMFHSLRVRVLLCVLAVVITAPGLMICVSRSALVHLFAAGSLAVLLPSANGRWRRIAAGVTVAATLAVTLTWCVPNDTMLAGLRERVVEMYTGLSLASEVVDQVSSGRLTNWSMAFDVWLERPLLGVGYKALIPLYGFPGDNTFLLALAETGMLGLTALAVLFGGFLCHGAAAPWEPLRRILLLLWTGQLVHSLNVDMITFSASMSCVLLIAVAIWMNDTGGGAGPEAAK